MSNLEGQQQEVSQLPSGPILNNNILTVFLQPVEESTNNQTPSAAAYPEIQVLSPTCQTLKMLHIAKVTTNQSSIPNDQAESSSKISAI